MTISIPQSFYIDRNLFTTFEADIKAAYNDPSKVGVLNGVQINLLDHTTLNQWARLIEQHAKQAFMYGGFAITTIGVASVAAVILASPIGAIVAGSLALAFSSVCVVKMYREMKQCKSLVISCTQQRALEAQIYLAEGPIPLIRRKNDVATTANNAARNYSRLSLR